MRFLTRFAALAATLSLTLVAATASAEGAQAPSSHARIADGGAHGKKFPMAGAEFKQKVDQRIVTARQKLETRIASLPADKQKEIRDKFNAGVQVVNAEVARAVADNVVTKDEAKKVRETARALRPAGGAGHRHAKGQKKT